MRQAICFPAYIHVLEHDPAKVSIRVLKTNTDYSQFVRHIHRVLGRRNNSDPRKIFGTHYKLITAKCYSSLSLSLSSHYIINGIYPRLSWRRKIRYVMLKYYGG